MKQHQPLATTSTESTIILAGIKFQTNVFEIDRLASLLALRGCLQVCAEEASLEI